MNKRVMLVSAIVALSVVLLVWVTQIVRAQERPSASASASVAAPRDQTQLFLPLVLKNYVPPAPLWRFGVAKVRRAFTDYDYNDILSMRFGRYIDFGVTINAPQPYGMEYSPVVRLKQWKLKEGNTWTQCCVGCPYVTPYTYTVSPSITQIQAVAASRPGMLWIIGNEIERIDFGVGYCGRQDEMLPEVYAQAYHDLYYTIKNADPTAQVAIGGMIGFTDLRRRYLDRVWEEYTRLYSETMPVDVWNFHVYVLQEKRGDWGADIPAGFSEDTGALYTVLDNKDFVNKAWPFVVEMRKWMNQHGQRNKPLITNEYGLHMPAWMGCPNYPNTTGCPFTPEQVRDSVLYPSFNYFMNRTDSNIGFPADGNRLIQRWTWMSLDYDDGECDAGIFYEYFNGSLFYSGLGPSGSPKDCAYPAQGISPLGTYWKQYVQSLPSGATRPYVLTQLPALSQGVASTALSTYQPATSDCPVEQKVRLEFYAPAPSGFSMEGLRGKMPSYKPFTSVKTQEMTVCVSPETK